VAAQLALQQRLGGRAVDGAAAACLKLGTHGGQRAEEGRGEAVPVLLGLHALGVKVLRMQRHALLGVEVSAQQPGGR